MTIIGLQFALAINRFIVPTIAKGEARMKFLPLCILVLATAFAAPGVAQESDDSQDADYQAYSSQPQQSNFPLIGITRKADFLLVSVAFSSDTREGVTRESEIHKMLLAAIDRAKASGLELATNASILAPLTKSNYKAVPMGSAGRVDTSKVDILVKVALTGTAEEATKRIDDFVKNLPRNGRGSIANTYFKTHTLAVRNPGQYRSAIVKAIAEDVRRNAEMFGPDYRASVAGIDKSVAWMQVNSTDVFLYMPYSYRIFAK